ncbi:hypothetical protein [Cetobacterium sp.]|uniref:hypothetical protein n=1 Tax=Cetobacterium sp. TaxID=2071632 RepID=UPI003F2AF071
MELDLNVLKELGIWGILAVMLVKQYQNKDNSQTKQNDELVSHLLDSNKKKDDMLRETVNEFKVFSSSLVTKLEKIEGKVSNIEQKIK